MLEQTYIKESLARLVCHRCGRPLDGAELIPVTGVSTSFVAHVTCAKCRAQSVVTVTPLGVGAVPLVSDLIGAEFRNFLGLNAVSYDEVLDLHRELRGKSIWSLLQKKEESLAKKQKTLEKSPKYPA